MDPPLLTDPHDISIFLMKLMELRVLLVTPQRQACEVEIRKAGGKGAREAVQTVEGRSVYEYAEVDAEDGGRN